jgi:Zn finger protein HypA/HybF involved in hydrogenase expression
METKLEEAAERCVLDNADMRASYSAGEYAEFTFKEGAKWQQERTFSFNSNFIPSIIEKYLETAFISKEQGYMNPKEWLEQFKKKQEKVICPLCKGEEYSITKSGFKCAYTDCQKEW